MTVNDSIATVDQIKPNQFKKADKVRWLDFLDRQLIDLIFLHYENADDYSDFEGYSADDPDTLDDDLLVPDPYSQLYVSFLSYKIDLNSEEYNRYNNNAVVYQSELQEFRNFWNRTHMPIQKARTIAR